MSALYNNFLESWVPPATQFRLVYADQNAISQQRCDAGMVAVGAPDLTGASPSMTPPQYVTWEGGETAGTACSLSRWVNRNPGVALLIALGVFALLKPKR